MQLETIQHLAQLPTWILRMDEGAVRKFRVLEQADVATEQDAMFGAGNRQQLRIPVIVSIKAVESEQAQVGSEAAEVYVEYESRLTQRLWSQTRDARKVETFEYGIDRDPLAATQSMWEGSRLAIDQDQIDLGMRHSEGFDRILDRGRAIEGIGEAALAETGREEVVQLLIEAEFAMVRHVAGPARLRVSWTGR